MNSHSDIQKLLSAYCGNDLPAGDCALVEEHLRDCPACRAELSDLRIITRLIRTTPDVEPPPWMTARIMAHVREEKGSRRSWLKNLFFPLHIKIPLEVMALLAVCVSGYYMSRTVETELKAPKVLQDAPPAAPVEDKPAKREITVPPPMSNFEKTVPDIAPHKIRESRRDSVPPSDNAPSVPAIPQPAIEKDSSAPAAGAAAEPAAKSAPGAGLSNRSLEASPEMKKKSAKGTARQEAETMAPAPAGRAAGDPAEAYVPQLLLRLTLTDSASSAGDIRSAAIRSGARIVEEPGPDANRIKFRIAALNMPELAEKLRRIGKLSDHPRSYGNAREIEVTIQW